MREQSQKYVFAYVLALALLAGASGCATMPVHMLNSSVETYNGKDQTYQLTNSVTIGQVVHQSQMRVCIRTGGNFTKTINALKKSRPETHCLKARRG